MQTTLQDLQTKYIQLQKKIDNLASVVHILSQNDGAKSLSQITNIKIQLKQLENKIQANKLKITYIENSIDDVKKLINQFKKAQYKIDEQQKESLSSLLTKLQNIKDDLHKIHIQLTQNDGQTNQCYISIAKIEQAIQKYHPITANAIKDNQQSQKMQETQDNIKSLFYKIIVGTIISISLFFLSWIGSKYWNAIINDLVDKNTSNGQIQQVQVKPSTIKLEEGKTK